MKVLVVRVGAMGDVLHALPAVAELRRLQPSWRIDWAIDPRWSPLLVGNDERGPVVDMVHLVRAKAWSKRKFSGATLRSVMELRKRLREEHYDLVVDMQGTLRSGMIGWFASGDVFAGYSDPREGLAARFYSRRLPRRGTHVVDQGAGLLGEACDVRLVPGAVALPREPWAEEWAAGRVGGRRVCLLAPGAGWGAKRWPVEAFGALARELRGHGLDVMVNGSSEDDALAAAVVAASGGTAEVVACDVMGLIALTRRVAVVVGGDSGPVHLAAALDVPLVALYGPTDPARNGPWGLGAMRVLRDAASVTSHRKVAETEAGLARISVEQVVEAIEGLLRS